MGYERSISFLSEPIDIFQSDLTSDPESGETWQTLIVSNKRGAVVRLCPLPKVYLER